MMNPRYFPNPYEDYQIGEEIKVDKSYLTNHIAELAMFSVKRTRLDVASCDGGLYVGNIGLIYMIHKVLINSLAENYHQDLVKYLNESLNLNARYFDANKSDRASFILGNGGYYAMGALVAKHFKRDDQMVDYFASEYAKSARIVERENFLRHGCDELFVGRAGYLCGALYFRNNIGIEVNKLKKKKLIKVFY